MRILSYVFANKSTGLGHFHRSLALARTAQARGHTVFIASDRVPPDELRHIPTRYDDPVTYIRALQLAQPDWLIVDIPHTPPKWIRAGTKCKICTLNGIGYNQLDGADLRIVQGMADLDLPGPQDKVPVLKGIEYVILRPELEKYQGMVKGKEVLVWGGGANVLNLHQRFFEACPGWFAVHILSEMATLPLFSSPTQTAMRSNADSDDIFAWLAGSQRAVVAMGMIVFEALFLRVKIHCFNASWLHLLFSQAMAKQGLLKSFPSVGLPPRDEMRAFLEEDFELPKETGLDLNGASRVLEAIEQY